MIVPGHLAARSCVPQDDVNNRARYWHTTDDGRVQCDLCPRYCTMRDGQAGFCSVRRNTDGMLELTAYGYPSGLAIDPIEKKPLYHVMPGARVLSFGTTGCNLACRFCQNWELSTSRAGGLAGRPMSPEAMVAVALENGCQGIAYTYNDPVIFAEYAIDVAETAHQAGLLNIAVTAGYIEPEPRADFFVHMDAANVDMKAMDPAFYRTLTGGRLDVVQDTLRYLAHETDVWVEVTNLVIPGLNDSEAGIRELSAWVATEMGPDVPLHLSAFHPSHRMMDVPRTPASTLFEARCIALDAGLRFVYTGNVADEDGGTTWCWSCHQPLIERRGFQVVANRLVDGHCRCGALIPGCWG